MVALFGDGDLTPKDRVLAKVAQMKSENIRFITRGLGWAAAREFAEISDEEASAAAVERVEDLAAGDRRHGHRPEAGRPRDADHPSVTADMEI